MKVSQVSQRHFWYSLILLLVRTETNQETLQKSLLSYMGDNPSQNDLKEAFCRDIDAYSFEFEPQNPVVPVAGGNRVVSNIVQIVELVFKA